MSNANAERFGRLLHETTRDWRHALNRRLRPLGLSQTKWMALLHLARAEQPLTQKTLAARLGIEAATLVGLLDRLHADGWIERREDRLDRRCKTIHLAPGSSPVIDRISEIAAGLRHELLDGITPVDLDTTLRVLDEIRARIAALTQGEASSTDDT